MLLIKRKDLSEKRKAKFKLLENLAQKRNKEVEILQEQVKRIKSEKKIRCRFG